MPSPISSILPLFLLSLSSLIFLVSFQSPQPTRILLSPLLFLPALYALTLSATAWAWLPAASNLFALFVIIWILHSGTILFLEDLHLPGSIKPWSRQAWLTAYQIYNDPARHALAQTTQPPTELPPLKLNTSRPNSTTPTSRLLFFLRQTTHLSLIWILQTSILNPYISTHFRFSSTSFSPVRQTLLRRLLPTLAPSLAPPTFDPISTHDLRLRALFALYWIWLAYLMLTTAHLLLSIPFVCILHLDAPSSWPALFGSPFQASSIRHFWSHFWHKLGVRSLGVWGTTLIARVQRGTGLKIRKTEKKVFLACFIFAFSGLIHELADVFSGDYVGGIPNTWFFLANFGAGLGESLVQRGLDRVEMMYPAVRGWRRNEGVKRVVGFVWVYAFFFWVVPKWQYPKMWVVFGEMERVQMEQIRAQRARQMQYGR